MPRMGTSWITVLIRRGAGEHQEPLTTDRIRGAVPGTGTS